MNVLQVPDFMEKDDHKETYESQKVLGKLYRDAVNLQDFLRKQKKRRHHGFPDAALCHKNWEVFRQEAEMIHQEYLTGLVQIMQDSGIDSEIRVICGREKWRRRQKSDIEEQKAVSQRVEELNKSVRSRFNALSQADPNKDRQKLASACYMVAAAGGGEGLAFPWLFADELAKLRKVNKLASKDNQLQATHAWDKIVDKLGITCTNVSLLLLKLLESNNTQKLQSSYESFLKKHHDMFQHDAGNEKLVNGIVCYLFYIAGHCSCNIQHPDSCCDRKFTSQFKDKAKLALLKLVAVVDEVI